MHRIDTPTADPNANGTGKAGFRAGAPPGTASTRLDHDWFNSTQEEICNVIEGAGLTLDKPTKTQLKSAIDSLISTASASTTVSLARAAAKTVLCDLRLACATGAAHTLRAAARKASTRRIVAVGDTGTIVSSDGFTPFTVETPGSSYTGNFQDVLYDSTLGLFIAVGTVGEIQSAPDGQTWTRRANGGANILALGSNGSGTLVAVGASEFLKSSTNGTSWTSRTSPFAGTPNIVSVTYGAGLWVMVTDQGDIATSPDAITWTVRQALAGSVNSRSRAAYHSTLGFLYHYGTTVYCSADGITWTTLHNAVPSSGTAVPGLRLLPYCWLIVVASGTGGAYVDGRFSVSTTNTAADFTIDFVNGADDLEWLGVLDGQLWATATDRVFVGGTL